MNRLTCLVAIVALFVQTEGNVFGGIVTVVGDIGDGTIDVNGLPQDFGLSMLRVGPGGDNLRGLAPVFFFALPTLSSPSALLGADLRFQFLDITRATVVTPPEFSVDLFGIGTRATPTILASDYYDGNAAISKDSLISKGLATPSTAPGSLGASGSGLLNFVSSLYNPDGSPTAAYAVFRLNADIHLPVGSGPYRGYEFASADNTGGSGAFVPQLLLTAAVPEPSSVSLVMLGACTLLAQYGRRRRVDTTCGDGGTTAKRA